MMNKLTGALALSLIAAQADALNLNAMHLSPEEQMAADAAAAAEIAAAAAATIAATEGLGAEADAGADAGADADDESDHDDGCGCNGCGSNNVKIDIGFNVTAGGAADGGDDTAADDAAAGEEGAEEGAAAGEEMTEEVELADSASVAGSTWAEYKTTAMADGFVDGPEFAALSARDQAWVTELIAAQTLTGDNAGALDGGSSTITWSSSSSSSDGAVDGAADGAAEDMEAEEPSSVGITTSSATSTQTVVETSKIVLEDGTETTFDAWRDASGTTPADVFESEAYGLLSASSQKKLIKLVAATEFENGGELPEAWIPLTLPYMVTVETTTRTGPLSENTLVVGMTWGDWKASDAFDLATFAETNDAYLNGTEADQALFDALIALQMENGDNVIATTESMDIDSDMITVEDATPM